jgi:Sulfotransferase family
VTGRPLSPDYAGENLVFVVGCPRSGTTWVQRLLASHPRVQTGQESDLFDMYIGPQLRAWQHELQVDSSGRGGVGLGCYFTDSEFRATLKDYMLRLLEPMVGGLDHDELFLEKTPSHVLYVPEIHALLPKARFINVLRDARDTVASIMSASRGWGSAWAPRQAARAATMWVQHVTAGCEATRMLPSELMTHVRYEDLHADGPVVLARLFGWLGLDWSEADVHDVLVRNSPDAARAGRGTPIPLGGHFAATHGPTVTEPHGFVRQARAGTWRSDLQFGDKVAIWRVARTTMASVGYHWSTPWSR